MKIKPIKSEKDYFYFVMFRYTMIRHLNCTKFQIGAPFFL
jgi:hypothetical protein